MMMKQSGRDKERGIRVAVTHGDFNGISYEVIIKSLRDNRLYELFTPVVYGIPKMIGFYRKMMHLNDFNYNVIDDVSKMDAHKLNIRSLSNEEINIEFGRSTSLAGEYAYNALEAAVADLKQNKVDVLVTAPINKANIHSDSFHYQGHTEYLTDRFEANDSLMLMVAGNLKVGTVTNHIPIKDVADTLTEELILKKLSLLNESLRKDFLIARPKIAVLGLNPHAGDDGLIGEEDKTLIHDSLVTAKKQGILAFGPFPADGFFGSGAYAKYDAILGMYHDQSLIPFKILAGESGVNYTAGLSIVRTSPDHGTAYDIAGKNKASEVSMRQAIYLAIEIFKNRKKYAEMNANPLHPSPETTTGRRNNHDGNTSKK